ncbi:MAG TPA: hypothetical protein VK858_17980 [Longimicrobiales bacterium]|nr:hypothetical protein [Longimicrobiales bacterium]
MHLLAEAFAANGRRIDANGRAVEALTEKVDLNGRRDPGGA